MVISMILVIAFGTICFFIGYIMAGSAKTEIPSQIILK
jgi:hypothetical protein